jgi:hypothetical protein
MLDPWTGLPYDQIAFGGPWAMAPGGINRAWGVVPQLAYADINGFAEDPARLSSTVDWTFVDAGPSAAAKPELLFATRLALHLSPPDVTPYNRFGGLIWGAATNLRRYRALHIRYSTSTPDPIWELKLNLGRSARVEPMVVLPGSAPGRWTDARYELATTFPDPDAASGLGPFLNSIVLATSSERGQTDPILWIDRISFEADPAQAASCDALCPTAAGEYDLACYEPMTGAVNVANALSSLSLLPAVRLLDRDVAQAKVARILDSLESFPRAAEASFFQDWHSPASGMPDPRNRVASLTDQPQLYAALMVVERTWPALRTRAAALRAQMDFAPLYDPGAGCPGTLYGAVDRCTGIRRDWRVEVFGNDSFLGAFLAQATGATPPCFWSEGLAERGCQIDGPADAGWYTTGQYCMNPTIPASDTGGPFLQLAGLLYLSPGQIPLGPLSLADSARNMLRAQDAYAHQRGLKLAGWANASDPSELTYLTCERFTDDKVTPYIWLMGLDLLGPRAARRALDFQYAGAAAPMSTGTRQHRFGLRDGWNQATNSGRDAYLYLDTGWSTLGLLNACHGDLVRRRFGSHPIAQAGYAALRSQMPACSAP